MAHRRALQTLQLQRIHSRTILAPPQKVATNSRFRQFSTYPRSLAPYPTREEITSLAKNMETGNYSEFFKHVSPNVDWTVMGTHACAGRYKSLEDFQKATFARLGKIMKEPGIKLMVRATSLAVAINRGAQWNWWQKLTA